MTRFTYLNLPSVASSSSILFNFEREINGLLRDSTHVGYSDLSFETGGSESFMKSSPGMGVPTFIGRAKMRVDVMCRLVDRTVVFFNDRPVWSDKILAAFICNRAYSFFIRNEEKKLRYSFPCHSQRIQPLSVHSSSSSRCLSKFLLKSGLWRSWY